MPQLALVFPVMGASASNSIIEAAPSLIKYAKEGEIAYHYYKVTELSDSIESAGELVVHGDKLLELGEWDKANYAYYRVFYLLKMYKFNLPSFLALSDRFEGMMDLAHSRSILAYVLRAFKLSTEQKAAIESKLHALSV